MQSYVYQASIPYTNMDAMLLSVRNHVKQLRNTYPHLNDYQLADIGMKRLRSEVAITLYFTPGQVKKPILRQLNSSNS